MKKKVGIVVASLVGIGLLGFGVYQTDAAPADPQLSSAEVRELVLAQHSGEITEFELEKDFNKAVYEVEVISDGIEYDLRLDGDSGEVLRTKEKELAEQVEFTDDDSDGLDEVKNENQANGEKINLQKAEEIALNEFPGTVNQLELDEDDDRLIYEVEISNGKEEAEIEIDAFTGNILELDTDRD
ncbi:hypothetical protein CV093_03155 [Oceanobacillus sp. 143]|uniref:PepSY domain-containing protein n=1 Tax=Oceanobacillus zhaokaii TaxID=2052660 RepID=A0A345PDE1_9BACI|nr:PepSY domain-containing protein [Oceanobacillus zhaokaii]AXI08021.1 hypothetical protein CUC15_03065 [Oceanobacillus zhaokaii]QGS68033.1 hypothetical protein CV093_03155 [Oceanobacillus sp. 143]